jgi:hypothetical protein
MNQIVASSIEIDRFILIIMTAAASMALFLTAIGLYGVISYSVEPRRSESGSHWALNPHMCGIWSCVADRR